MKLYIIAGEASGDLHGSNLIKALKVQQPDIQCRVWGGDLMRAAGGELVKHYRDLAFMGFVEVLKNLRTIFRNIAFCKKDVLDFQPDALVLIDYPGFNLRIAKWAKKQGLKVIYYISPQIWAWHTSRVHDIKRDVDKMLVILPFEEDFYKKYGVEVEFVGHPLLDAVDGRGYTVHDVSQTSNSKLQTPNFKLQTPNSKLQTPNFKLQTPNSKLQTPNFKLQTPNSKLQTPNLVALLPGSRRQEVQRILPVMLGVAADFPEYEFVVAGATSLPEDYYRPFLEKYPNVRLAQGQTYDLLRRATAALVKSGTSTLETALFDVPQVVCYAGNPLSYFIARRLVNVQYISLVNLIMDRPLVRELIQNELNKNNLKTALAEILLPEKSAAMRAGYAELRQKLGDGGASERAAKVILKFLR